MSLLFSQFVAVLFTTQRRRKLRSTGTDPTSLPDDVTLLKAMILELQSTLHREQRTNVKLQQQLEQLLRRLYGPRGEKFDPPGPLPCSPN